MRGDAHIETAASAPAPQSRHRLDDLVREIGRGGFFGRRAAPLVWGFAGFLIGAMFWHVIGFWGFLSDVVLKGPEPQASVVVNEAPTAMLPNCTTLALNRATGMTTSVPCIEQMPLLEEARIGRQDLAFAEMHLDEVKPASVVVVSHQN
ncbi:MAG: hypothetical protein J0I57_08480 [Hyphomicrobium sp.]|nr:hypothetical protein [Hyphomicrobium sp.]